MKPQIDAAIARVVDRCSFILGEEVDRFEKAFAAFCEAKGAVGVASGTAALHLALQAAGIGSGDEVITSTMTFTATGEAIANVGARPIFVDVDPQTLNLDPARVEAAVTTRTKAIIAVHLYGQPADMEALEAIAKRRNLVLIEDAAQAHGARFRGQRCGGSDRLTCFSFYPGKNLGAFGDAGAVTSNDDALLAKVRRLRDHGRVSKYEHLEIGWGERIDALQAAILAEKLPLLEGWNQSRRTLARRYTELLAGTPLQPLHESKSVDHVFHLYVSRTPRRDALLAHLQSKGVGAGIHYPIPLHRQPAYAQFGYADVQLPVAEAAAAQIISLPLFPEMSPEQQGAVVAAVKEFGV